MNFDQILLVYIVECVIVHPYVSQFHYNEFGLYECLAFLFLTQIVTHKGQKLRQNAKLKCGIINGAM